MSEWVSEKSADWSNPNLFLPSFTFNCSPIKHTLAKCNLSNSFLSSSLIAIKVSPKVCKNPFPHFFILPSHQRVLCWYGLMQFNSLAYNKYSSIQHKVPSQKLQKHTHKHRASNSFFALFVYRPKDSIRIFIVVFENFLSLKHSSIFSGWICLIFYSIRCNAMRCDENAIFPSLFVLGLDGPIKRQNECFFRFPFFLDPKAG